MQINKILCRNKFLVLKTVIITVLMLIIIGCQNIDNTSNSNNNVQKTVTLSDSLGREITTNIPAKQIISLAASNTEIIFAIGADENLIGRDEYSDYPPEALNVESIGSLYPQVNSEIIVNLEPDLILAAGITNPEDVKTLENLGFIVYTSSNASNLDDIYNDISNIGILTGNIENAIALIENMKSRVKAIETQVDRQSVSIFYEIDATEPSKPWTPGSGSFIDTIITSAGGQNIGANSDDPYWQISLEQLIDLDPDIIILGSSKYGGQNISTVTNRSGWESLSAVKTKQIYEFDDDLVSRPGPRVIEGLETISNIINKVNK
ncbi:MAG TPA: cobalamin-binding protein [Chloroflexi bacterium]|nr:cobalamin-binding protein [Chloroflexota bacterium]